MKAYDYTFPVSIESENASANEGMTNRDYIAIKAMSAILTLAEPNNFENINRYRYDDGAIDAETIAIEAYQIADAMIKESNKTK